MVGLLVAESVQKPEEEVLEVEHKTVAEETLVAAAAATEPVATMPFHLALATIVERRKRLERTQLGLMAARVTVATVAATEAAMLVATEMETPVEMATETVAAIE